MTNKISPAIFGIALICFLLPFINLSCSGQKFMSLTGMQLITGTTIEQPGMFKQEQPKKIKGEMLAVLAFVSIAAGLGLSLLKANKNNIIAVIGVIGAVLLLLLKFKMDNDVLKQGKGMIQIEYAVGFWLTFLLNIVATIWNIFQFSQRKKDVEKDT